MAEKKAPKKSSKNDYSASDIYVLEGLEPVRKRPGMYIGSTGIDGLHHLVWEVFDNSLDEAMAGHADLITVTLMENSRVSVSDNGRGIPVEKHKQTGVSALETVMTTLHAGGKFGGDAYKVAGGLHGVGVSVVNALSSWLKAEIHRDGFVYEQEYERGDPKKKLKKVGPSKLTGTTVTFEPDPEIFKEREFNVDTILTHLRQQAYLTKGIRIDVIDQRNPVQAADSKEPQYATYSFYFEGGIVSYVDYLTHGMNTKNKNVFYTGQQHDNMFVEVAMQYVDDFNGNEISFANNIHTTEGGMHLTGFKTALTRVLNDYARKNNILKEKEENLTGEDVREGMVAIISIKIASAVLQFEGQTKTKLGNPEARGAVETVMVREFADWLDRNPGDARSILEKVLLASKARVAAKAARETVLRKGILDGLTLPGKLADCSSRDASESEIFIVEGDSAGGSSKQGRDRKIQAILPLKGKILNVERARIDRILGHEDIRSLIIAMGVGIGAEFDIEKLRYHKVVIMTDADVDGSHIRTLLLTLFFRYFRPLIDNGHIFIAQPPLYSIGRRGSLRYAYTDEERDRIIDEIAAETKAKAVSKKKSAKTEQTEETEEGTSKDEKTPEEGDGKASGLFIQRYKGLGEMNPEQLWETTMNPENRMLYQVTVKDAQEADKTFDILMGVEVAPRKKFIQTHATQVENLDI